MKCCKQLLKGFVFLNLLVCILLVVNAIPQSAISNGVEKSLFHYQDQDNRIAVIPNLSQTTDDTITDLIILNIAHNGNANKFFKSTLLAEYYLDDEIGYNEQLKQTVQNKQKPNASYSRYWHGYMIVVRTLLTCCDMTGIKNIMFSAYLFLLGVLVSVSIRKKMLKFSILYIMSSVLGTLFFEFFTVGHLAPVFISLIGCIYIIQKDNFDSHELFLSLGIAVAFFDFLSTEILTLSLPLICLLLKKNKQNECVSYKEFSILNIYWLLGYMGTYIYKWVLIALFYGKEYLVDAYEKGVEKIISKDLFAGLYLNIQMLFPHLNSSTTAMFIFCIVLVVLLAILFLFHKDGCNRNNFVLYLSFIFIIPYIRYVILSNHSFVHYFFTYRAQVSSILIMLLLFSTILDWSLIRRCFLKKKK